MLYIGRFHKVSMFLIISMVVFYTVVPTTASTIIPTGIDIGPVRFDAILELNAPGADTHVVLFVRYWVTPEHYSASVVWAEPHAGNLNYATYPVTTSISSDLQHFNLHNQIYKSYDTTFTKPVEDQYVFTYINNDYDIKDMRYADSEALKSRIYLSDVPQSEKKVEDCWRTLKLQGFDKQENSSRTVREISTHEVNGRINAIKLYSTGGQLLKDVEYEYSKDNKFEISTLNIVSPECSILVGSKDTKAKVLLENKDVRSYTSWPAKNHVGGRRCIVQFGDVRVNDAIARLPQRITVYNNEKNNMLRSAKLFNFVPIKESDPELGMVKTFADFNADEMAWRKMVLKCWLRSPTQVSSEDANSMWQLCQKFSDKAAQDSSPGRVLRRINMLMMLDLMQGNKAALSEHFQDYLDYLIVNDLKYMALVGGQHMIDLASRWKQYPVADKLLEKWLNTVTNACKAETILRFCQSAAIKHRFWTTVLLINKIELAEVSGDGHLKAKILQAESLYGLLRILNNNDLATTNIERAQIAWVSLSLGVDDVSDMFNSTVYEAEQQYLTLGKSAPERRVLAEKLEDLKRRTRDGSIPK